jgi:hypothetical protein
MTIVWLTTKEIVPGDIFTGSWIDDINDAPHGRRRYTSTWQNSIVVGKVIALQYKGDAVTYKITLLCRNTKIVSIFRESNEQLEIVRQ